MILFKWQFDIFTHTTDWKQYLLRRLQVHSKLFDTFSLRSSVNGTPRLMNLYFSLLKHFYRLKNSKSKTVEPLKKRHKKHQFGPCLNRFYAVFKYRSCECFVFIYLSYDIESWRDVFRTCFQILCSYNLILSCLTSDHSLRARVFALIREQSFERGDARTSKFGNCTILRREVQKPTTSRHWDHEFITACLEIYFAVGTPTNTWQLMDSQIFSDDCMLTLNEVCRGLRILF